MEPIDQKESIVRSMYFELFSLSSRIKELKSIPVFNENGSDYDLANQEIRLLEDQQISLNRFVKQIINL